MSATRTDSTGYGRGGRRDLAVVVTSLGPAVVTDLVGYRMIAQSVGDLVAGLLLDRGHHSVMSRDGWCSLGDPMADGSGMAQWSGNFSDDASLVGESLLLRLPGVDIFVTSSLAFAMWTSRLR